MRYLYLVDTLYNIYTYTLIMPGVGAIRSFTTSQGVEKVS